MLLSTVTAEDTIDSGDFAEVAFTEVPGGKLITRGYPTHSLISPTSPGDSNHIVLNQVTGELRLGVAPIDYDEPTNDRSFTLSVKAVDYPEGPVANQLEVSFAASFLSLITPFSLFFSLSLPLTCSLGRHLCRQSPSWTAMITLQYLVNLHTALL